MACRKARLFYFAAILNKSFYSSRIDAFPFTIFAEVKNNNDICVFNKLVLDIKDLL